METTTTFQLLSETQVPDDDLMMQWKRFFKATDQFDENRRRYALGKLCIWVLVNYLYERSGLYPTEIFRKRSYCGLHFVVLNRKTQVGERLDNVMKQISKFIESSVLRSVRFQISPLEDSHVVMEEMQFQFRYGHPFEAEFFFGNAQNITVEFADNSFESFIQSFQHMMRKIQEFCSKLQPLPEIFEKRFRASFRAPIPQTVGAGPFADNAVQYTYANDMILLHVGKASIDDVAVVAVLHTRFASQDDIDLEQFERASRSQKSSKTPPNQPDNGAGDGPQDDYPDDQPNGGANEPDHQTPRENGENTDEEDNGRVYEFELTPEIARDTQGSPKQSIVLTSQSHTLPTTDDANKSDDGDLYTTSDEDYVVESKRKRFNTTSIHLSETRSVRISRGNPHNMDESH
ncbi:hypothetical protein M3Y98_00560000 [Aphelenchoides besseyi]|nr:hypothetical protein M3Y98_00560000 [Aphelenchoides besseyi]KAI6193661.1 hypothetical protein M3Y96_01042400 [Aphelenchoides besseyi]